MKARPTVRWFVVDVVHHLLPHRDLKKKINPHTVPTYTATTRSEKKKTNKNRTIVGEGETGGVVRWFVGGGVMRHNG